MWDEAARDALLFEGVAQADGRANGGSEVAVGKGGTSSWQLVGRFESSVAMGVVLFRGAEQRNDSYDIRFRLRASCVLSKRATQIEATLCLVEHNA